MLFLVLLFASSVLSAPNPCTTPAQWEATAIREDELNSVTVRGLLSYDATNQRERYLMVDVFGQADPTDTLYLFEEKKLFIFNLKTKVCEKYDLTFNWTNAGVPDGSKFAGEVFIGSPVVSGVNIRASTWSNTFPNPNDPIAYFGMFSEPSCLPLTIGYQSKDIGRLTYNFFDITPGIKDPSVFTPRPECSNL